MSEYGPALFIARNDKKEINRAEQKKLITHTTAAAKKLTLKDVEGRALKPRLYDYDGYEKKALGVLLFSWYGYESMPEEVRAGEDQTWEEEGRRLGKELEEAHPGVYTFKCYYVEV